MITLTEAVYYKLKFLIAECEINRMKAQQILALVEQKRAEALITAGLDPRQPYHLDDATHSAIPVPAAQITPHQDTIGAGVSDGQGSKSEGGSAPADEAGRVDKRRAKRREDFRFGV